MNRDIHSEVYQGGGECVPARLIITTQLAAASGAIRLTFFRAKRSEKINNLAAVVGSVAASGLTLAKLGVYSVDSGFVTLTLQAATASTTSAFGSTGSSTGSIATTSELDKRAGRWYAIATLQIGTTPAALGCPTGILTGVQAAAATRKPLTYASIGGQTDLPASLAVSGLTIQSAGHFVELLP